MAGCPNLRTACPGQALEGRKSASRGFGRCRRIATWKIRAQLLNSRRVARPAAVETASSVRPHPPEPTLRFPIYDYDFRRSPEAAAPARSSPPTATTVGVSYYGVRYYNPNTGRWLSRDPIEEWGGVNLYGMVEDDPVDLADAVGFVAIPTTSSLLTPEGVEVMTWLAGNGGTVATAGGVGVGVTAVVVKQSNSPKPQKNPKRLPIPIPPYLPSNDDSVHSGRIQAQGNGVEKSSVWLQKVPLTRFQGQAVLRSLVSKLTPEEQQQRTSAIIQASEFIEAVAATGVGVGPMKKTFLEVKTTTTPSAIKCPGETRIDIEVLKGLAFVPP